jgi:hypothetical protein
MFTDFERLRLRSDQIYSDRHYFILLERLMRNRIASSFVIAIAFSGAAIAPAFASDDMFENIVQFPVRVVGSGFGAVVGVPLGAFRDSVKGWMAGTKMVAGGLGNAEGCVQQIVGGATGGPVGFVGGAAFGTVDGAVHGLKAGFGSPFGKDSFTFKDE